MTTKNQINNTIAHAKKAYKKPVVVEYGDVREFTRGPGGSCPDSKGGAGQDIPQGCP